VIISCDLLNLGTNIARPHHWKLILLGYWRRCLLCVTIGWIHTDLNCWLLASLFSFLCHPSTSLFVQICCSKMDYEVIEKILFVTHCHLKYVSSWLSGSGELVVSIVANRYGNVGCWENWYGHQSTAEVIGADFTIVCYLHAKFLALAPHTELA